MCQYLQYHSATNKMKRPQHKHRQLLFHQRPNSKTLYCRANHKLITSYNIRQQVHTEYNTAFVHTSLLRVKLSKFEYNQHAQIQTLKCIRICTCAPCGFNPSLTCAYTTHVSTYPLRSTGNLGARPVSDQVQGERGKVSQLKGVTTANGAQNSLFCLASPAFRMEGFPGGQHTHLQRV